MADQTIHERVTQAVARDAELHGQLLELRDALRKVKEAEDALRNRKVLETSKAELQNEMNEHIAQSRSVQDAAIARARGPYDAALAVFTKAKAEAEGEHVRKSGIATATYTAQLQEVTRACELEAASARAEVHRAQQEIAALQTTIDQHRRNIQERMGINLGNLLG